MAREAIAVTGASGFIGRALVGRLVERGHQVTSLQRSDIPTHPAARSLRWDAAHGSKQTAELLSGAGALVHLAAYLPSRYEDLDELEQCLKVNTSGTANLLAAAEIAGVKHFVHGSTASLYAPGTTPADEAAQLMPSRALAYLSSKLAAEVCVTGAINRGKIECSILRFSSVYGPGMPARGFIHSCVEKLKHAWPLVLDHGGQPRTDLIYVDDVAESICRVLERKAVGALNIASGRLVSLREIAMQAAAATGADPALVTCRDAALPAPDLFRTIDIARARKNLDLRPLELEQGLRAYAQSLS